MKWIGRGSNFLNTLYSTKCGIEDWNETIDMFSDSKRRDHEASSRTRDGRARAHARASNHGNGQYSSEAEASAAALKDGNKEGFIAESGAKGMNNRLSQIINSHSYLSYKALCLCLKGIRFEYCLPHFFFSSSHSSIFIILK